MQPGDTPHEPVTGAATSESIVWRQFKKRKMGLYSFYGVLLLFAIAIYAPLLANDKPLALYTTYADVYGYYYAGWQQVHERLVEGLGERERLLAEQKAAREGFEHQKEILRGLYEELTQLGDRYDALRSRTNRIQDRLDDLFEKKAAAAAAGQSAEALQAEIDRLTAEKAPIDEESKKAGAEQAGVRKRIETHRDVQELVHNQAILRTGFRLDFGRMRSFLVKNLESMRFPLDEAGDARLMGVRDRYGELLPGLAAGATPAEVHAALDPLAAEMREHLSPEAMRGSLVYRWSFPAFAQLDLSERFFMIAYLLLGILVLLKRPRSLGGGGRFVLAAVLGAALALLAGRLDRDLPDANYKQLLNVNLAAGWTESLGVFTPVPFGYNENHFDENYQKPSFLKQDGQHGRHLLGTDQNGRDVLSRLIWGARVSLTVSFVAVGLYVTIGILVGALAGYFGGWVDMVLSRLIEVVICFPSFFLILAVIAFLSPSMYNVMIVIGLTSWTGIARLVRAEFLKLRHQEFVVGARAMGGGHIRVMFRHILPNALTPVMVAAAFGFAGTILVESSLSFLGFGVQEPNPSWGQMIDSSKGSPLLYWWLFLVPGVALFLTVTFYNLVGNTFRDAADPRLRQ
jgi:ABC-type dipeptide/oligopeptide/nickel transport system permease subunit